MPDDTPFRLTIDILTVLPELLEGPFSHSILKRARERGLAEIRIHQLRDYTPSKQGQLDDYQFGGGAGMVMMPEPLALAIEALQKEGPFDEIIFLSPDGELLNQKIANQLSLKGRLLLICGHYKGIDERIREHFITREISIGDYVLSGGELPAAVLVDALVRLIPGALNDETSALTDSFQDNLLAPPVYTRPAKFRNWEVPPVLVSGNDRKIGEWRHEQALERTMKKRPDLLK
ncbi:MAG TPA: tRNA (guanosine(37)-N1)-methyltransferase TrmD [Chitinophagaceae bacterium]|nr:tRNA (guanosine(37)-N1)-methyltransferase TrmD [Chitinophagaceae bacterium]